MARLQDMSYEIFNRIAESLPVAEDIILFAKTCRVIKNAIYDTHASCWRHRFAQVFDLPPAKAVTAIRSKFVERGVLRLRLIFKLGDNRITRGMVSRVEEIVLERMRELIVGTYNVLRLDPFRQHPQLAYRIARIAGLTSPVLQNPTAYLPRRSRGRTTSGPYNTWQPARTSAP